MVVPEMPPIVDAAFSVAPVNVKPATVAAVPPSETEVEPTVTDEDASFETAIAADALMSASTIVPFAIIADVTVPESACVTAVPAIFDAAMLAAAATFAFAMLLIVFADASIVLFVNVCVDVVPTTAPDTPCAVVVLSMCAAGSEKSRADTPCFATAPAL